MTSDETKLLQIAILYANNSKEQDFFVSPIANIDSYIVDTHQFSNQLFSLTTYTYRIDNSKISRLKQAINQYNSRAKESCINYCTEALSLNSTQYLLYIIGKEVDSANIRSLINTIYEKSLYIIQMSNNSSTSSKYTSYCIKIGGSEENKERLYKELFKNYRSIFDFSIQQVNAFTQQKKLVCFDMDSTLIQTEVIDELAIRAGVGDQVKKITEQAMRGEIDFKASFSKRVSLLKGLDEAVMIEIANTLPITDGAEQLLSTLKKQGYKTAILSGGFTYFAKQLQQRFNFDYVFANNLEIVNKKLTGKYLGAVIDANKKVEILKNIAHLEQIDLQQTVAIGDGANDLLMLHEAGLGIAFHAKPKVQEQAQNLINQVGLDGVLYFLGLN